MQLQPFIGLLFDIYCYKAGIFFPISALSLFYCLFRVTWHLKNCFPPKVSYPASRVSFDRRRLCSQGMKLSERGTLQNLRRWSSQETYKFAVSLENNHEVFRIHRYHYKNTTAFACYVSSTAGSSFFFPSRKARGRWETDRKYPGCQRLFKRGVSRYSRKKKRPSRL